MELIKSIKYEYRSQYEPIVANIFGNSIDTKKPEVYMLELYNCLKSEKYVKSEEFILLLTAALMGNTCIYPKNKIKVHTATEFTYYSKDDVDIVPLAYEKAESNGIVNDSLGRLYRKDEYGRLVQKKCYLIIDIYKEDDDE